MSDPTLPDIVVVGHVCQDILPGGGLGLGGTASYAAITAQRLGLSVGLVTSTGPELNVADTFPGVQVACRPSPETTVFENIYFDGQRKQLLHGHARALRCTDIPDAWRSVRMIYLGSIDQELDDTLFDCFGPQAIVGVMPQGYFRRWDRHGRVSYTDWRPTEHILRQIDILTISELDVPEPEALAADWGRFIDTIVVTRAERGATVYQRGEVCNYAARPAQQVDPTGAGDVFATAFLIRFAETGDVCRAAEFANSVASFSVEGPGMTGIPTRAQVEAYLASTC